MLVPVRKLWNIAAKTVKSPVRLAKIAENSIEGAARNFLLRDYLPYKTGGEHPACLSVFWHSHLSSQSEGQTNRNIEGLFNDWYSRFDPSPELAVREEFIRKLKTHNRLGELLWNWVAMADKQYASTGSPSDKERETRVEALRIINRIFVATYFEPFGIRASSQVYFELTKNDYPREKASYRPETGIVKLAVPSTYGRSHLPSLFIGDQALSNQWPRRPDVIMTTYMEERMHQFQHEMGKLYLRGQLEPESPWVNFARPLLPQFSTTPGQKLYALGTYYLWNPIERHVEGFNRDVFDALNFANLQAVEAQELVKSHYGTASNASKNFSNVVNEICSADPKARRLPTLAKKPPPPFKPKDHPHS